MREILFRGKAINRNGSLHRTDYKNGDWVYGIVTRLYDERFENLPAEMTDTDGVSGIEVDYKTIGQYTGLTAKGGVRIFEGDIVNVKGVMGNGIIVYENAMFFVEYPLFIQLLADEEIEIIGNIFDNSYPSEVYRICDMKK